MYLWNKSLAMKKFTFVLLIAVLLVFALLTIFMTNSVIFDLFGIREKEGNFVPFVVWANWFCGFLYLAAAYGLAKKKEWTIQVLSIALAVLIITFTGLVFYIYTGGIYETKTVGAMLFRIAVTLAFAFLARNAINTNFKVNKQK